MPSDVACSGDAAEAREDLEDARWLSEVDLLTAPPLELSLLKAVGKVL